MNKKLFAGVSMMAAASAVFWACGEGNINEMTDMDNVILMQYPLDPVTGQASPELDNLKESALNSCKEDMGCYTQYQGYFDGTEVIEEPESSSSEENPGPYTNPLSSSSRSDINIVTKPSSSSIAIIENPVESSSSEVVVVSGLGSCAPATSPINKTGSAKWKFTPNLTAGTYKPADFAKATFAWNFPGGTPAVDATPSTSAAITYSASGSVTASVTVTMGDGASETIQCSPLQVNGDAITGCKCAPDGVTGAVDFTATPDVVWNVTGCTSASAITSYTWEGVEGTDPVFTKTFEAEANSYAPKLKIGNADNTVIDVACEAVKVTDGPEYKIDVSGADGKVKLPAGTSNVVLEVSGYNNQVFCQISRDDSPTGAVNGSVNKVTIKGSDYVAVNMPAGTLVAGASLTFILDVPATCGIQ